MKRRDFINSGLLTAFTGTLAAPTLLSGCTTQQQDLLGNTKNIIFLVSDGMSIGTLNMADLLMQRKLGKSSKWIELYRENKATRAFMDTASADSLVTDSAAASSSWGGGVRVNNGSLNVGPNGEMHKPILQKFKDAGKSVGCVTTVPITHATPAGFCVNEKSRSRQDKIASTYLDLRFDLMMGGGLEYFNGTKRKDGKNILPDFEAGGFHVMHTKAEMENVTAEKPILGVYNEDGLPYTLDQNSDTELAEKIPTLASMTKKAISLLSQNTEGFVLQVEGGKVDWAAHANDVGALLYDQIAFDEAVSAAIEFAESRNDTLVVVTTDHGNSNPGLIKSKNVNNKFDKIQSFKHTNEWILRGIKKNDSVSSVIERINYAQGITINEEEAKNILKDYSSLDNGGIYNDYKLPYRKFAEIQQNYLSVYWSGMNHSSDFVELAMFGEGSKALPMFVKNIDLHNYMLQATGILTA